MKKIVILTPIFVSLFLCITASQLDGKIKREAATIKEQIETNNLILNHQLVGNANYIIDLTTPALGVAFKTFDSTQATYLNNIISDFRANTGSYVYILLGEPYLIGSSGNDEELQEEIKTKVSNEIAVQMSDSGILIYLNPVLMLDRSTANRWAVYYNCAAFTNELVYGLYDINFLLYETTACAEYDTKADFIINQTEQIINASKGNYSAKTSIIFVRPENGPTGNAYGYYGAIKLSTVSEACNILLPNKPYLNGKMQNATYLYAIIPKEFRKQKVKISDFNFACTKATNPMDTLVRVVVDTIPQRGKYKVKITSTGKTGRENLRVYYDTNIVATANIFIESLEPFDWGTFNVYFVQRNNKPNINPTAIKQELEETINSFYLNHAVAYARIGNVVLSNNHNYNRNGSVVSNTDPTPVLDIFYNTFDYDNRIITPDNYEFYQLCMDHGGQPQPNDKRFIMVNAVFRDSFLAIDSLIKIKNGSLTLIGIPIDKNLDRWNSQIVRKIKSNMSTVITGDSIINHHFRFKDYFNIYNKGYMNNCGYVFVHSDKIDYKKFKFFNGNYSQNPYIYKQFTDPNQSTGGISTIPIISIMEDDKFSTKRVAKILIHEQMHLNNKKALHSNVKHNIFYHTTDDKTTPTKIVFLEHNANQSPFEYEDIDNFIRIK